jgi:hypothetical protein
LSDSITPYLPLNVINGIIRTPNTSLIKIKTPDFDFDFQEFISLSDVGLCLGYAVMFVLLSYFILKRRDI